MNVFRQTRHQARLAVPAVGILLACTLLALPAWASLRIEDFAVEIRVESTGDLLVTEQISVRFLTPYRGIERFIPIAGRTPWGTSVRMALRLLDVQKDGMPVLHSARRRGTAYVLRIGDPNRTITGLHIYTVQYRASRVFLFSDDSVRLYWNVTGNDWEIPIDRVSAIVRLPGSVSSDALASVSYMGYRGSTSRGPEAQALADGSLAFEAGSLYPGEGLTIDLLIPRGMIPFQPPSAAQRFLWFITANAYAALPVLVLLAMGILWWNRGKDPRKRIIAPAFAPPRDVDPAAAGVLIDDRVDLRDISAMLIGLAVKGHLSIQEEEEGEYVFVRKTASRDRLTQAENALFDAVFPEDDTDRRTMSSLENVFYKSLETIKSRLYGQLISASFYASNPERTRRLYTTIGFLFVPIAVFLGVHTLSISLAVSVAVCGLIVWAFAPFMPRKTAQGVRKLEEILGLAEYIRKAEVDRMEFHNAPDKGPELFERLLPYAIALNLTKIWTQQFEGLMQQPPSWYTGRPTTSPFHAARFSLVLSGLTRSMQSTFASQPRTAGSSAGGGRGSFGGGTSGGGFGGGGGRGW